MKSTAVACVGVGNVGRSWAIVFARAGCRVTLWDADPAACDRALRAIEQGLRDLAEAGALADPDEAFARVHVVAELEDAVAPAHWVQESAAEQLEAKQQLFARMDAIAPRDAILASSTSAIPGSQFMVGLTGSARCLVAHPVNPPHLIPLVELCGTAETAEPVIERAADFLTSLGQAPVRLNREIEGFLLNRLQWALLGEAMHLVGEGICSPQDIDRVLTDGLARRWSFIGPFAVAHLNASKGVEGYFDVLSEAIARVQGTLRCDYPPTVQVIDAAHAAMAATTPVSAIAERQQWRDRQLLKVNRFLTELEP